MTHDKSEFWMECKGCFHCERKLQAMYDTWLLYEDDFSNWTFVSILTRKKYYDEKTDFDVSRRGCDNNIGVQLVNIAAVTM